jgi:5-(carboxyamino)imidazole ribonucleotide synthase
MMGEEAHDVDVALCVLATSSEDPATTTADDFLLGGAKDPDALATLAEVVDVITFDHELVDLDLLRDLENRGVVVRPSSKALTFSVDKAHQRSVFGASGIRVPRFKVATSLDDPSLDEFLNSLEGEPVVKAARGGYDGRGVVFPDSRADTLEVIREMTTSGVAVVEERLKLESEVAQVLARDVEGSLAIYPLVTTVQSEGMCVEVGFPASVTNDVAATCRDTAVQIASLIDAVGIIAIEFFVTADGVFVNEIALRPHNSGHWTIEGAATSQFANHLLAVSGQALGDPSPLFGAAVMVNVVGGDQPSSPHAAQALEGVHVHDYRKAWRPKRKLGHVTCVGDDPRAVHVRAWEGARAYGTGSQEA